MKEPDKSFWQFSLYYKLRHLKNNPAIFTKATNMSGGDFS